MATRRIVTGINADGKSYFVHDGETPGHLDFGLMKTDEIWVDNPSKPDPNASDDPAQAEKHSLHPPEGGSTFRVFTFMPGNDDPQKVRDIVVEALSRFDTGDALEKDDPSMHTTPTIDYGVVLSGEIDLELDEGTVHLKAGDVVVQRATRHAWRNRSSEPCVVAFILISSPNYR